MAGGKNISISLEHMKVAARVSEANAEGLTCRTTFILLYEANSFRYASLSMKR
jgi:hypothetical protein